MPRWLGSSDEWQTPTYLNLSINHLATQYLFFNAAPWTILIKCRHVLFVVNMSRLPNYQWSYHWLNPLRPSDAYMCQESNHHWFTQWLPAWSAPSPYLSHCWGIVNWTNRNPLQRNSNLPLNIFIHENAFEGVVCEMVAIFSRSLWRHPNVRPFASLQYLWLQCYDLWSFPIT